MLCDPILLQYSCCPRALQRRKVMQGFGMGMRLGMTYDDLRQLVGIHPTVAEEITLLEITRRSASSSWGEPLLLLLVSNLVSNLVCCDGARFFVAET